MPYMMGRVTVEDYATFRKTFDGAVEMRKSAGALGSEVFQSADDPNEVIIQIEFPTVDDRRAGSAHRFGYATSSQSSVAEDPHALVKYDLAAVGKAVDPAVPVELDHGRNAVGQPLSPHEGVRLVRVRHRDS